MEITKVKVTKSEGNNSKLLAYVDVTVDDSIAIHGIKVIQGDEKIFIAFPSVRKSDGAYSDIVHPINSKVRKSFEDAILSEYELVK